MNENGAHGERLDSWKSICDYLERDVSTLLRWEKEKGLPIHRIPGGQRQAVYAFRDELDAWLAKPNHEPGAEQALPNGNRRVPVHEIPADAFAQASATSAKLRIAFGWRLALYVFGGILIFLLLAVSGFRYLDHRLSFHVPEFVGQQQLTDNGLNKYGLLTNGKQLYFGQSENGWLALVAMPEDGGAVRTVWNPPANVWPVDLSPDGRKLMAYTYVSPERERPLWIVPLDGGEPHRVADVMARSAAFAPNGRTIAYAKGEKIYLIAEDGSSTREIGSFNGLPDELHWSEDGERLRFMLVDEGTDLPSSSWELVSTDGMKKTTLRSLPSTMAFRLGKSWTRANPENAYFLIMDSSHNKGESAWLAQFGARWWEPPLQMSEIQLSMKMMTGMAFDRGTQRLFVLGGSGARGSFVRFDPQTNGFREILPGIAGEYLDYSRDGQWIAFVNLAVGKESLWVSKADGSNMRQLTSLPDNVQLPRWSPDGRQIAYMFLKPDHPWRIYILELATGVAREASEGNDNQGAPSWSPDGRFLVYGTVQCQPSHSCVIRRIDLSTGKVQTLPGSEGLFTARWSPDGRWIAAMRLEQHQVFLFDVQTSRWHKLADAMEGTDLSWSADSRYLYTNFGGPNARIERIRATDGQRETVADLHSQNMFNLAEVGDIGFSLAPDNSLILHRRDDSLEIYSYELRER